MVIMYVFINYIQVLLKREQICEYYLIEQFWIVLEVSLLFRYYFVLDYEKYLDLYMMWVVKGN